MFVIYFNTKFQIAAAVFISYCCQSKKLNIHFMQLSYCLFTFYGK